MENNQFSRITILIVFVSTLLCSCSKDESTTSFFLSPDDYYPLKVGVWHIYDVDSISYDDFTDPVTIDTISYQVKEELTDTFFDLEGNLSFKLTRSKRAQNDSSVIQESIPWKISDIWWVKKINGNINRIEENVRYVSLSNSVSEGKKWNGNAFNHINQWDYTYINVEKEFGEYSNTITVSQREEDLVIIYKDYTEVYAKDIGLISRTRIDLEAQDIENPLPVLQKAEKGFQYFQKLISYYIPE
tara:strand:+ start:1455 stop:2186 length:732 start_codon:yes stop_codon:yes gene_type:complete